MELRDYLRIIRTSWIVIIAVTLVALGAAVAYSVVKPPVYAASAKVFVSVQNNDTVTDLVQGNAFSQSKVKTYAELVTTPAVLAPVIEALGLDASVTNIAERVTATVPLDTTLIQIDATAADPGEAADIANAASQSLAAAVDELETPQSDGGVSPVRITQVTEALVPESAVSPNIPLNLALGFLVGLALGLGIAVLRETLDTRIRGEHDITGLTSAPLVGGIAYDAKASERPLIVQDDPRSVRAESFRTLRTNFQFLRGGGRRSFVFTSSVQAEGKTSTVANLAIALAEAGRSVVVVDADLRRPRLADLLGLDGAVGLSDLLIGRAEFDDLVQPWGRGGVDVLPAGRIPPNPSELLGSTAMVELLAQLEERYDYVLFDAPPLLPVTDAAVLAGHAAGAILIVAAGRTRKAHVRATVAALDKVSVVPVGVVLTMLPAKGPDAYGYGYVADPAQNAEWSRQEDSRIPRPAEPANPASPPGEPASARGASAERPATGRARPADRAPHPGVDDREDTDKSMLVEFATKRPVVRYRPPRVGRRPGEPRR